MLKILWDTWNNRNDNNDNDGDEEPVIDILYKNFQVPNVKTKTI
jgi:hypothetical protein